MVVLFRLLNLLTVVHYHLIKTAIQRSAQFSNSDEGRMDEIYCLAFMIKSSSYKHHHSALLAQLHASIAGKMPQVCSAGANIPSFITSHSTCFGPT